MERSAALFWVDAHNAQIFHKVFQLNWTDLTDPK